MRRQRVIREVVLAMAAAVLAGAPLAAEIRFRDVAEAWRFEFNHRHGGRGDFYMIETMGSGVALWDYDGDGDEDVLFIDSGDPGPSAALESERRNGTKLYRNDLGGFVDVTERAGLRVAGYGMGAAVADIEGDGDLDLYVTAFGANQLFLNQGDGTLLDATADSALIDTGWSASAAFVDGDLDGLLDLYVTHYVDFDYDNNRICGLEERSLRSYCHPNVYRGEPDRYFRNLGLVGSALGQGKSPRFVDATEAMGFAAAQGNGLGVAVGDLDLDGRPDLYVANDMTPNFQFRNRPGGFEEVALLTGTALSDLGKPEAGMGVEIGDLDGDGRADIMVTHLDGETNAVYGNLGDDLFVDRRFSSGLAESSINQVGFGLTFSDLDLDGDLDVAVANGHIIHNIEHWNRGGHYKQRNQVFENLGPGRGVGRFREIEASGVDRVRSSRGLVAGDLDGDCDLDLVINNSNDVAEVYENVSAIGGCVRVALIDPGSGNREALGTKVVLTANGQQQLREVERVASYQSSKPAELTYGLGSAEGAEISIRWPRGPRLGIAGVRPGQRLVVVRERETSAR